MLEYPEVKTLCAQLAASVASKRVAKVLPPSKPHKFCWFNGEPAEYDAKLRSARAVDFNGFGIYAEIGFDNGMKLCVNDGVNVRLINADDAPKAYQLLIVFDDGAALAFTVAMYGGIVLHDGSYDNEYYLKSLAALDPLSDEFAARFRELITSEPQKLSAKAFLATQQRFPGIGNGVVQDILFRASIHPKRKIATLGEQQRETLLKSCVDTLSEMTRLGGRDTEKDLFGASGGYQTLMSKNALECGCPRCGGEVTKEAYLGGSVYYCPVCQPLPAK